MFGNLFNQDKNQPQQPNTTGKLPQNGVQPPQSLNGQTPVQPQPPQGFAQPQNPFPQQPQQPTQGMPQAPLQPTGQPPQQPQQPPQPSQQGQPNGTPQPSISPEKDAQLEGVKKDNVSMLSRLDPRSTIVLNTATDEAKRVKHESVEPDQLLFALTQDKEIAKTFQEFKLDPQKIAQDIQNKEQPGTFEGKPTLSGSVQAILTKAFELAKKREASFISPEDILLALFDSAEKEFLEQEGIQKEKVEKHLEQNAEYSLGRRSVLDKYGIDLTKEAQDGKLDPIAGREKEIERLIHILLRRTKNNPALIGEAGVGKTAIVEGVAQAIVAGQVPEQLKGRKIIQLDLSSLIAGASHRGEFEDRLRNVIKEVQVASGQIILFVDEIHTIIGAGESGGALDASNIIKPYLARGQLQLIGTTTTAEFRKYFEKDKAFQRRFQPIIVTEPSEENAEKMLEVIKPKYEKFHNVVYSPEAIKAAVHLSKKYIGERYLPDKGVDLMDEAASEVKLAKGRGKRDDNKVTREDVEKIVSDWTGIPITKLTEDESEKLLKLEDLIHKRLIDQEEAVGAVSEAVRRGRIGLASAKRPIASFIFLGPTGVGKTELAKTLAEIMFGRDDATIRLDMSEYMEKHEVAKLIGAPPGYVGYEEGGQLTEAVRAKPYSIVLLDEVEKAHPDVFNILLQLLEDGRLTDNKGNTISFKNTIIIATSNIGSQVIQKYLLKQANESKKEQGQQSSKENTQENKTQDPTQALQQDQTKKSGIQGNATDVADESEVNYEELTNLISEELHKFFKPELLNRFDEIVLFKPLARKDMVKIAQLGIEKTRKLIQEQGYDMQITQNALDQIAKEGYDPVFGARPLRRLIQTAIENPLAVHLISKKVQKGDTILIDYDTQKQEYTFTKKQTQQSAQNNNSQDQQPATQTPQQNQPAQAETPQPTQSPQQQPQSPQTNGTGQSQNSTGQVPQTPPPANPPTQGQGGTQMQPNTNA